MEIESRFGLKMGTRRFIDVNSEPHERCEQAPQITLLKKIKKKKKKKERESFCNDKDFKELTGTRGASKTR